MSLLLENFWVFKASGAVHLMGNFPVFFQGILNNKGFRINENLSLNFELLLLIKDACMVKPGFKQVPPQLYFEFAALFQEKKRQVQNKVGENWFDSGFYSIFMG